ncbi:DUF4239 domain-containing protein [Taklimakanibacter deserti]|uniref:bestrophin-like domain n=1 Tax=Taklimakanibacter deserti TaxID=2267839 RepID=UPI000E64BDBE
MIWLYHLPPIGLLLVLSLFIGAAAFGLWWLPKLSVTFTLVRAGREMSPVIQTICGTLFVMATTFLAANVWAVEDRAYEAVAIEAREVRLLRTLSHLLPEPRRSEVGNLVTDYAGQSAAEWPHMDDLGGSREAERVLAALYNAALSLAPHEQMLGQEFMAALKAVGEARERRLDIARNNLSPDQWAAMLILALTLGVAVTIVHGDSDGGRALALGLIAVIVSTALFLLIAHDRPFIGWDALEPQSVIAAARGS